MDGPEGQITKNQPRNQQNIIDRDLDLDSINQMKIVGLRLFF